MPRVNHEILRWARETAGLTKLEAAEKVGLRAARGQTPDERLDALETGEVAPTRPLLLRMAKQYRRPLLTFYLPHAPRVADRGEDFRTLPEDQPAEDEAVLDALLRDIKTRQALLRAGMEDAEEALPLSFVGSSNISLGADAILATLRDTVGMDLREFRRAQSAAAAFAVLREHVEDAGVFVILKGDLGSHHTALDVDTFRGFCLADPVAPFIVINDRDARSAWSFTLLHEFTHILLGQSGVSGGTPELAVERFCNDVASEYLLPSNELHALRPRESRGLDQLISTISDFANVRNVSSSMVAYKLHRAGAIGVGVWRQLQARYRQLWQAERDRSRQRGEDEGGPNYYVVRRHRLGDALLSSAARLLASGNLTSAKTAQVLGIKAHQLPQVLAGTRPVNRAS